MSKESFESFYGKTIAVQDNIYWTNKYVVTIHKEIVTAVLRNPPDECIINKEQKDIPGQQSLLD